MQDKPHENERGLEVTQKSRNVSATALTSKTLEGRKGKGKYIQENTKTQPQQKQHKQQGDTEGGSKKGGEKTKPIHLTTRGDSYAKKWNNIRYPRRVAVWGDRGNKFEGKGDASYRFQTTLEQRGVKDERLQNGKLTKRFKYTSLFNVN